MDDPLDVLCVLHLRVNAGMDYLRTHIADPARFERGKRRLIALVTREYSPALTDLVAGGDPEHLAAQRDQLAGRLERGWTVDRPGADELFADLTTRYEVLSDALAGNPYLAIMQRIERLEAVAA